MNFPTSMGSKDLWKHCNQHGTVADVYIAQKLSKIGRRFAFVRFLKVMNTGSLIDDLNKIWIGTYHLFTAMARFERKPNDPPKSNPKTTTTHTHNQSKPASHSSHANPNRSYVATLNGKSSQNYVPKETVILKFVTLDLSDLMDTTDIRNVILVKVRDVHLILNINNVLRKEGFYDFQSKYIGGKNSDMGISHNHDDVNSNNSAQDAEEGEIRGTNEVHEENDVNNHHFLWADDAVNILKDHDDSLIRNQPIESQKQHPTETSKSPRLSVGKNHQNSKQTSSSFNGAKSSRASKSHSKSFSNKGSMIEAFISHIEMGKVLGYDMKGKCKAISKLCNKHNISFLGIQETHSLMIDPFKVKCLWGNSQFDYDVSPSSGISGGLVSVWDPNAFTKLIVFPSENLLIVEGNWISTHMHCYMVNVYAPQDDRKKEILWHNILDFKKGNPGHYLIFGDFNEIPHGGHLFTRINRRGDKLSKLDRFLITENSVSHMHNYSAQVLDCHISDHRPIILSASSLDFGPIPFKFYNSWLLEKQLHTIVTEFWEQHVAEIGSNSISREKDDLINKIKEFDAATVRGYGNLVVDSQRSTWIENLRNIEMKENLDISQKAKKRRTLSIHGIKHEGHWLSDPQTIKDAFHSFFESKFKKVDVVKIVVRSPFYKTLHEDQNSFLVSTVTEAEIRDAIWDCGSDKSSGPDGFTFAFYKKFWDTIKDDVTNFVQVFFNTSILPHRSTSSILVNGSPAREFHINRGLHQGDPLSPFLFNIAMEGLHVAVEDAISTGLYRGLKVNTMTLSQFFFANDALLLDCNMANSKSWDPIIDKFSKCLSKWKSSLLSSGGRSTLISSVLGAIGTYYFSLFPMPVTVNNKLESLRSNFSREVMLMSKRFRGSPRDKFLLLKIKEGLVLVAFTL
ncbi:RNA-directed DNA polymerase, eukaryota [Tanacetum coccineum]